VGLQALIAGRVSYLHMHLLVELRGQPGWVAALTPLSVDGMIMAASTTLLVAGSLAANVAVAQPTAAGRVIAAWPSFAPIGAYELLMRQVRRGAGARGQPPRAASPPIHPESDGGAVPRLRRLSQIEPHGTGGLVVPRGGIFNGRRGCGHWPIRQRMAGFQRQ
jgi:hypothetical protein